MSENVTTTQISADLMRRWCATLFDIALFTIVLLWPAVALLEGKMAFDERAKASIVIIWVGYQWGFQRFAGASLGQRLAGYRIVPVETGHPRYLKRVFYAYLAFAITLQTLLTAGEDRNDVFWWDKRTHTRALLMKAPSSRY